MCARTETESLLHRLTSRGVRVDFDHAQTLRRAQLTLHRWAELECGHGDDYKSWAIERDDESGKPYMAICPHQGESRRYKVADRETGALRRVAAVCKAAGLYFYHQTDPRGCALWVSPEPINDQDYTRGVAC